MLIRIISVISLIQFLLLMVSGSSLNTALYRSLMVFLVLFSVVYIATFFMNIIHKKNETATDSRSTADTDNSQSNRMEQ